MHDVILPQLLILLIVVWTVAMVLRRFGLPTIMGELAMGVIIGPAVLGWIHPNEIIEILALLGIFFIMLHTGVTTEPREFFSALKVSLGVAIVGALVPFGVSFGVALAFGLELMPALFVGLIMTATAVVVTLKILRDLRLAETRVARVILAACVIDDLFAIILFSLVLGIVRDGATSPLALLAIVGKATAFFAVVSAIGIWAYPHFRTPFQDRRGKAFTFLLIVALSFGLMAELLGLHMILGAYFAGLFFEEKVVSAELFKNVSERLDGLAYSFLGPIFFISLGFHISFDALSGNGLMFVLALTGVCAVGQVLSAGSMARLLKFSWAESAAVGIGMCARAEMAVILASLGLTMGVLDQKIFSILIFTTFLLNMITPIGLKLCAGAITSDRSTPKSENMQAAE